MIEIRSILDIAKTKIAQTIHNELILSYWKIRESIVRYEKNDSIRAAYREQTLKHLSKELTKEFGKGFSRSNLQNMHEFYLNYPKYQTLTDKLSWIHYFELLSISDVPKRQFYEIQNKL